MQTTNPSPDLPGYHKTKGLAAKVFQQNKMPMKNAFAPEVPEEGIKSGYQFNYDAQGAYDEDGNPIITTPKPDGWPRQSYLTLCKAEGGDADNSSGRSPREDSQDSGQEPIQ